MLRKEALKDHRILSLLSKLQIWILPLKNVSSILLSQYMLSLKLLHCKKGDDDDISLSKYVLSTYYGANPHLISVKEGGKGH